jgi:ferredoxin
MKHQEISSDILEQVNAILQKDIDPLYFEVAERIAPELKNSKYLPWMLAHKMSPDGCRVLLALPDPNWKPGMGYYEVSEEFIEKLGLDRDFVLRQLEDSYYNGDLYPDNKLGPIITPNRGMWIDTQNSRRWIERNGPAYYMIHRFFQEQESAPLAEIDIGRRKASGVVGVGRIVPRYDSVKDCPDLLPVENYKEILKTRKVISLNQCPCRLRYPELGQNKNVCISGNRVAEMAIRRELGREITWEEAFEHIQEVGKKEPFCQTAKHCMDMEDMGDIFCNCNPLSCSILRHTFVTGGKYKIWDCFHKSRFRAVIDPKKCINCGLCKNKRCIFKAIHFKYLRDAGKEGFYVDENLCMGCGCCAETCPTGALTMKLVDPPEVLLGYELDEKGKPVIPEEQPAPAGEEVFDPTKSW